ncbi:MAG TPA: DUF5060 domain-containing protein [Bryobacteraceae bacterium]|nr:DUF5060 domain-containing protein [Bryobacteraceae bacterium]
MASRITRRSAIFGATAAALSLQVDGQSGSGTVERWGIFEISLHGPADGNPYLDVRLSAELRHQNRVLDVSGFYDGDGAYKLRFMPDSEGEWSWTTRSNRPELDGKRGRFVCSKAQPENHGPVIVRDIFQFGYADGAVYCPFGTTCYAWAHQGDALEEQTLATLRSAPFNKIRMCVFPKWYAYNNVEPQYYPFPRSSSGENDLSRFDPLFFRHFEARVAQLSALGIQADLILFHPYDHWGYANLPAEVNDRYLRYVIARLAACRNVWWSVANEWDLVKSKTLADWDHFFRVIQESDPYGHLRSIHHSKVMYDHAKSWVTHASIQGDQFDRTPEWRDAFQKPVVFDECKYEGNIPRRWGDISAREMVRRFWLGVVMGGWVGHGETYLDPHDVLWWSKGGVLKGESAPRVRFLRELIDSAPPGMKPMPASYYPCLARAGEQYLYFLDYHQPAEFAFDLPAEGRFRAELIDPWNMTITAAPGEFHAKAQLKLRGEPYQAVRFRRS